MSENPDYLETVSLHLARVLDEIGLNHVTVKKRRWTYLFKEHMQTTFWSSIDNEMSVYHFGSQTEGATTPGLRSDLDSLVCCQVCNAIQDWAEWQLDKVNLLMLHEETPPGYCRLQLLSEDTPTAVDTLLGNDNFVFDSSDRVIVKNALLNCNIIGLVRNGPAQSMIGEPGFTDHDHVLAVKCKSWPRQAGEFISRQRRHNWPTQNLLQHVVQQGVFLVPVGHTLSPTEQLERRLSASQAERCLMFSLNIVHIKVYVLLKMLLKSFVEPRARKCISSYHCKTALLFCVENTESGFWVEKNLLQCVKRCLALLLSWVTECFCPQFICSDANLFAGKVTVQNRGTLQSIIRDLIISNGRVLLGVLIDDFGHKLQLHLTKEPAVIPALDSPTTVILIGIFEKCMYDSITRTRNILCLQAGNTEPITVIHAVYTSIEILKGRIRQLDKPKRQATEAIIEFLCGWLGSLLASFSLSHKMRAPRVAIQLLRTRAQFGVAAMLKFASVLYCNKDYNKVETVLQGVDNHLNSNMIQPICNCYAKPIRTPPDILHMMYALRGRKARAQLMTSCVVFYRQEIHCAPPGLLNELFRYVGYEHQHRYPKKDNWMDMAVVDCYPYLHFLQYITYRQLGNFLLQKQSLLNLERCIREDNALGHLETAWNLLGQCLELDDFPGTAMTCYMTSLEIRQTKNAANWHIAILCYKVIKPHL